MADHAGRPETGVYPRLEREVWISQFRSELQRLKPAMPNAHLWSFAEGAWQNGGLLPPRVIASVVAEMA